MSVVVAELVLAAGRTAESILDGHDAYALAGISVEVVDEGLGLKVVADPLSDEPAHALVVGHKTKATRRAMARAARWVVPPPGQDGETQVTE